MNDDFTQTELMVQYLDGEMAPSDAANLEQEIRNSRPLQEKLENLIAVKRSVQLFALRQQVKSIHTEMVMPYRRPARVLRLNKRTILGIAASLLIAMALGVFLEYRQLSPASLYRENYQPYTIAQVRGASDSGTLALSYRTGNFAEVIRLFNGNPNPAIRDFFLAGNSFLNTGDTKEAIRAFTAVYTKNAQFHTHVLEDDTDYYLAMGYLKNGEPDKALPLFEKIKHDPEHPYHDKVGNWWLYKIRWAHK